MPITNPTPKARFQTSKDNVSAHRDLMQRPQFEHACDMALLDYQRRLSTQSTTFNDAAANYFKVTGAMEFLQTLRNLGETTTMPTVLDKDNLNQS